VHLELVEDDADVLEMLCPRRTIDENIIKKYQDEPLYVWSQHVVHQAYNVVGALGRPNGMTRNS
jgi:hypothetical protein